MIGIKNLNEMNEIIIMKSGINNNENLKLSTIKTEYNNLIKERDLKDHIIFLRDKYLENDDLYVNKLTFLEKKKFKIILNINNNKINNFDVINRTKNKDNIK